MNSETLDSSFWFGLVLSLCVKKQSMHTLKQSYGLLNASTCYSFIIYDSQKHLRSTVVHFLGLFSADVTHTAWLQTAQQKWVNMQNDRQAAWEDFCVTPTIQTYKYTHFRTQPVSEYAFFLWRNKIHQSTVILTDVFENKWHGWFIAQCPT